MPLYHTSSHSSSQPTAIHHGHLGSSSSSSSLWTWSSDSSSSSDLICFISLHLQNQTKSDWFQPSLLLQHGLKSLVELLRRRDLGINIFPSSFRFGNLPSNFNTVPRSIWLMLASQINRKALEIQKFNRRPSVVNQAIRSKSDPLMNWCAEEAAEVNQRFSALALKHPEMYHLGAGPNGMQGA